MSKYIDESRVIMQFEDEHGVVHEVSLNNLLDGGTPINESDESEMELLGTYLLEA